MNQTIEERFQLLAGELFAAYELDSWVLTRELEFVSTSCKEKDFFYNLLLTGNAGEELRNHVSDTDPIVTADRLGIGWIAQTAEDSFLLLGPFFTLNAAERHVRQMCHEAHFPSSMVEIFLRNLEDLPVIGVNAAMGLSAMLHYCVNLEKIAHDSVILCLESGSDQNRSRSEEWSSPKWHGTWQIEKQMIEAFKRGDLAGFERATRMMSSDQIGEMSNGDPLRQAKNSGIVYTTMLSRAAIEAGVSAEGSYNLSDYYIQRLEASRFVSDVYQILDEMKTVYFQRVRMVISTKQYSAAVRTATEYIRTHVHEKIDLEDIAKEAGYTAYYLSGKFQKETGESINSYIRRQKIETAKQMMETGRWSSVDIAEQLSFSSPSYFASVFRKYSGMTPTEYIEKYRIG